MDLPIGTEFFWSIQSIRCTACSYGRPNLLAGHSTWTCRRHVVHCPRTALWEIAPAWSKRLPKFRPGAKALGARKPSFRKEPHRSEEHTSELQSPMYLVC